MFSMADDSRKCALAGGGRTMEEFGRIVITLSGRKACTWQQGCRATTCNDRREDAPRGQQTPEALAAIQKAEIAKWWPLIKEAGIKLKAEQARRGQAAVEAHPGIPECRGDGERT